MAYDPRELQLLEAQPHIERLQQLTDELVGVRDSFMPIYRYFFPDSWPVTVARAFRLLRHPDSQRFRTELQALRDQAWRIVDDAQLPFEAIGKSRIELKIKRFVQLLYTQIDVDGGVIILMNEWTRATNPDDAIMYGIGMKHMANRARDNLAQMGALAAGIR